MKITLTDLANLQNETTAVNAINANNVVLETAFDNTLSRDGSSPNVMNANLDMNGNRVINLPIPSNSTEPIRLADLTNFTQFQNSVNLSAAVASAANSATSATTSATASAASATAAAGSASLLSSGYMNIFSYIPAGQIAAIQNGTTTYDAGPAINTAIAAAAGQPIFFPQGTYLIQTQIKYVNSGVSGFVPGVQLFGDGFNTTIFKSQIAGDSLSSAFTTAIGSVVITVSWPNHGLNALDVFTLFTLGSTSYGGLDMEGDWSVTSVPDANHITFNHWAPATSTITTTGTARYTKHCMYFDTAGAFMLGTTLKDFQIQGSTNLGGGGVRLRRQANLSVKNFWVNGAQADGVHIPCVFGDSDSSFNLSFDNCRFTACGRWGFVAVAGSTVVAGVPTGHNEISNLTMNNTAFDSCGNNQGLYNYGGGMSWKGQIAELSNVTASTCNNCAIYINCRSLMGLPSGFIFRSLTLENNTARQFVVEGCDTIVGQLLEMYNNDSFVAFTGLYLHGIASINNVNIQSSIIRATAGNNNYIAFLGDGANLGTKIRIYTPSFQNFGFAGQTQASGITFLP